MDAMIHLIYGSDNNYWLPTAVSAASAVRCSRKPIVIHIFDFGIEDSNFAELEKIVHTGGDCVCERNKVDKGIFAGFGEWRGSIATYSRMFVQDILPDLDWAIYVDGDTLWTGDISKLWSYRDDACLLQASIDPPMPMGGKHPDEDWYIENGLEVPREQYLCMGLVLLNLKKLRAEGVTDRIKDFMVRYPRPKVVDQTVLNYVCKGSCRALPPEWGVFSTWHGTVDMRKDGCVHYVNDVPWRRHKINRLMSDIVLLWFEFSKSVLGMDMRRRFIGRFEWGWRRVVFQVLKHLQFLVRMHPFVRSRLRNTHGLKSEELAEIRKRWRKVVQ